MARKVQATTPTSVDERVELKKKKQEETKQTITENALAWFNRVTGGDDGRDNTNRDNIAHAAVTTVDLLRDSIGFVYDEEMWPFIPMIYDAVFESLIEELASKRSMYKRYKIIVGHNFEISYDNVDTGMAEQEGCFIPMMDHLGESLRVTGRVNSSKKVTYTTIDNMYGENYATNSDIEHIKAVANKKLQKMYSTDKDGNILESDKSTLYLPPNLVMIIFSLFHDALLMRLKMMKDAAPDDDVQLNVMGLYIVKIMDVENPEDATYNGRFILFEPKDIFKLSLKSDQIASDQVNNLD